MDSRLVSQSFLGPDSDAVLAGLEVAVIGLGGGGSHIVQQLAHLGVGKFVIIDFDKIENKNSNRLVGGTAEDVERAFEKVAIAQRLILAVNASAHVAACCTRWQAELPTLRRCDVIFGCVDSYRERDELERFARRFLIPYLDIGMDVHETPGGFSIGGQVVLSSPGGPCLWCLGILNQARLTREAEQYGKAGSRAQVVWPNGVLASLAVGLFVQLVCPWHDKPQLAACCEFGGNRHRVEMNRFDHLGDRVCSHYGPEAVGDAFFGKI